MRILFEETYENLRITYMHHDSKYIVRIEDDFLQEQIYKFREGANCGSPADVKSFISKDFLDNVNMIFKTMKSIKIKSQELTKNQNFDFPQII